MSIKNSLFALQKSGSLGGGFLRGGFPEIAPVQVNREGVKHDDEAVNGGEAMIDLQPAADGGAEGPAETVDHADQAGDGGA